MRTQSTESEDGRSKSKVFLLLFTCYHIASHMSNDEKNGMNIANMDNEHCGGNKQKTNKGQFFFVMYICME